MQRILYVTTLVVITEYYGAADTNVTDKIIDDSTSLAKHTMTKPNSIIENAPEHAIVKLLSNLMSKHVSHAKKHAKAIFRNEYGKNNDININIKVNYENKNASHSTKQEDDASNIKNINRNGIVLDYSNNALEESYELLTENHSEQDDVESDVVNAETFYYVDGEDDSNDNPEIEYLVEYDEALMQTSKEFKPRSNIEDKKRARNNKKHLRMIRYKKHKKKPNLLLKKQIKIDNASNANKPKKLMEMKTYDKIVREVTRYPHVKNKRFKILSGLQPKFKKIIKVKKVANSANKKLKSTKMIKLIGIKTNNNKNDGVTSHIASQSYPNKQLKQKYQKWKFNELYSDQNQDTSEIETKEQNRNKTRVRQNNNYNANAIVAAKKHKNLREETKSFDITNNLYNDQNQDTSEEETTEQIHYRNKTRVRQNNNYNAFVAATKHKNLREATKTVNITPINDKHISSNTISPKDNIKTLNNASDDKILMDILTKKLSQDVVINNLTDYLLTKIVQRIALQNELARKNNTADERIIIDLKGQLTEEESDSANWSEPSQEVRVLGGGREKPNLRIRRLQVK